MNVHVSNDQAKAFWGLPTIFDSQPIQPNQKKKSHPQLGSEVRSLGRHTQLSAGPGEVHERLDHWAFRSRSSRSSGTWRGPK